MKETIGKCLKPVRRVHRGEKGQATAELILLTPLIVFLLLIIVDFSILLAHWAMANNGVHNGARLGALGGTVGPTQICARTLDTSNNILKGSEVTVGYADANADGIVGNRGDSVVVGANHPYKFLFLSRLFSIGPSFNLPTNGDMRLEVAVAGATGGSTCPG